MRIAYYMPLKALGHSVPSGDLAIGTGLYDFFISKSKLLHCSLGPIYIYMGLLRVHHF